MANRAKNKLQLTDVTPYHKQQQGQIGQTNNTLIKENKTTKTPSMRDVGTIAKELNIKIEAAVTMKKSVWKRRIKDKVQNKI